MATRTKVKSLKSDAPLLRLIKKDEPRRTARRKFRVAGLFAGIGGLELGLHRAGHEAGLICEIDPAARAVLDEQFPDVKKHGDICTLTSFPRGVDLVVGGFPCQDLSQAGKTAGISGAKSGLVGEVFRLLENRRVPWVLLENVPFMMQLARGRALDVIVRAFEQLGYRWAYRVVDSRAFGLPQRRERLFFLASLDEDPRTVLFADEAGALPVATGTRKVACGFYWTEGVRGLGWAVDAVPTLKGGSTIGIPSQPAIFFPNGEIAKPEIRDAERMQGFDVDWTLPAEKVAKKGQRWKLVGNAVTVDVAEWIGERLAMPGAYADWADAPLAEGASWPRAAWNLGGGRFSANLSAYPVVRKRESLDRFLKFPTVQLSAKATAGFLSRARTGSLRFPEGFLEAVEAHLHRMQDANIAV